MSVQPLLPAAPVLERLFTPGLRLGWTFHDHRTLAAPYREPQPDPEVASGQIAERAASAQVRYARARRWLIKPSLAAGLILLLLAGYALGRGHAASGAVTLIAAVAVTGSGLGYTIRCWWQRGRTAAARPQESYQQELAVWGSQSLTRTDTEGAGDSVTRSRSWQEFRLGPGGRTRGTSASRNWSTAQSWADGTSWSDAAATQRVYEYAVEPGVLQNLPDHALLLDARGPRGAELQAVECDPAIAATAQPGAYRAGLDVAPGWPARPVRHSEPARLPRTPAPWPPRRPPGRHRG